MTQPSKKLSDKFLGPYEVLAHVTSHNSHVTLLTNLGQFQELSHQSHPHAKVPYWNSSSPEQSCISDIRLFRSQSVLLFYILVSVPNYCPVIVFLFRLLYQQLRSRTLLCFLLCLIVFSFLLFLTLIVYKALNM